MESTKSYDIKKVSTIILGLLLVVVAFGVLAKNGISSIQKLNKELQSERQAIKVLAENISTLKKIDSTVINKTDQIFVAMPDRPLVPLLISNVKTVGEGAFTIDTIRNESAGVVEIGEIKATGLYYEGSVDEILKAVTALDSLQNYAPLTSVNEMNIKVADGTYKMIFKVSTYWSELPTELPQLTEPVKDLTSDEVKIMNDVFQFRRPSSSNLTPQGPVDRPNPFI